MAETDDNREGVIPVGDISRYQDVLERGSHPLKNTHEEHNQ